MTRQPTVVAIDLGAESCRVSLLRWNGAQPEVTLAYRFSNGPVSRGGHLRWDLDAIWSGINDGLKRAAELAPDGIDSIGVDGWAVDYVRLDRDGRPLAQPFCYRDPRVIAAQSEAHKKISPSRLYELTGVQDLRFNTLYQLCADHTAGLSPSAPWINLPEYILHKLGARPISEYTNATHTGLIDLQTKSWCEEIFSALGFDPASAPELVPPGAQVGKLTGPLTAIPAFRNTRLIAPACHDTASAIAGIPANAANWAYISSGTWSLIGTVLPAACVSQPALDHNFTNLGAAGAGVLFHTSVNGMWLLQQCMIEWRRQHPSLELDVVLAAAEIFPPQPALLRLDDPELLLPGNMPHRINQQLRQRGLAELPESPSAAPQLASLILHSLASRYAEILAALPAITGRPLDELFIVGGGSRNQFLNRLTEQATGLRVSIGHAESSTMGNFAVQLAALNTGTPPSAAEIHSCARTLKHATLSGCA